MDSNTYLHPAYKTVQMQYKLLENTLIFKMLTVIITHPLPVRWGSISQLVVTRFLKCLPLTIKIPPVMRIPKIQFLSRSDNIRQVGQTGFLNKAQQSTHVMLIYSTCACAHCTHNHTYKMHSTFSIHSQH